MLGGAALGVSEGAVVTTVVAIVTATGVVLAGTLPPLISTRRAVGKKNGSSLVEKVEDIHADLVVVGEDAKKALAASEANGERLDEFAARLGRVERKVRKR